MSLPPLAEIPPPNIRLSIAPEEWRACIESWTTLAGLYLRLPSQALTDSLQSGQSITPFLRSFYHETAHSQTGDDTLHTAPAARLRKICFSLVKAIISVPRKNNELLRFDFTADFCRSHANSPLLPPLLRTVWSRQDGPLQKQLEAKKVALLKDLNSPSGVTSPGSLRPVIDVMRALPEAGTFFMTGADFLDALFSRYENATLREEKRMLVATAYFGLMSLVAAEPMHVSLLSDQLYSLKAQAEKAKDSPSLLADLATNTTLTIKLRRTIANTSNTRLHTLLDSIDTFRTPSLAQTRKHPQRKQGKGKGKAMLLDGEMHMHRMSFVTQIQDLFPDLGSGFVLKLLDEYNDDVEQVTAHLLDDSLPPHLRDLDRAEQAPVFDTSQRAQIDSLEPRSTPPVEPFIPDRRNVFDDDELDRLEYDASRLHLGKRNEVVPEAGQPNKAAILSALAAFDSDDDERDDTYDVDDVGGTVDTAHPDGEPGPSAKVTQEENEMALFAAYRASPQLFGRTFDIRRGQHRQALKAETGMTDEQIEGWATMLQRDPGRLKRLEARSGMVDGNRSALGRTAYRENPNGTETEDSDTPADRGGFRGRGRGRGFGGRGRGNVAGPSSDPKTADAQRRKEASKGSRANHNRRDQRARKMARGGFPG